MRAIVKLKVIFRSFNEINASLIALDIINFNNVSILICQVEFAELEQHEDVFLFLRPRIRAIFSHMGTWHPSLMPQSEQLDSPFPEQQSYATSIFTPRRSTNVLLEEENKFVAI